MYIQNKGNGPRYTSILGSRLLTLAAIAPEPPAPKDEEAAHGARHDDVPQNQPADCTHEWCGGHGQTNEVTVCIRLKYNIQAIVSLTGVVEAYVLRHWLTKQSLSEQLQL
jgi:hypothetical protein